jgi:hypothetical protein
MKGRDLRKGGIHAEGAKGIHAESAKGTHAEGAKVKSHMLARSYDPCSLLFLRSELLSNTRIPLLTTAHVSSRGAGGI